MPVLRRFAAALINLCLLQLTLLGGIAPHAMMSASGGGAAGMGAMGGMVQMHETPASIASVPAQASGSDSSGMPLGCDEPGGHHGCSLPGVPGQCATMTSCATAVARSGDVLVRATPSLPLDATLLVAVGVLHSAPSEAPELPPPRA